MISVGTQRLEGSILTKPTLSPFGCVSSTVESEIASRKRASAARATRLRARRRAARRHGLLPEISRSVSPAAVPMSSGGGSIANSAVPVRPLFELGLVEEEVPLRAEHVVRDPRGDEV